MQSRVKFEMKIFPLNSQIEQNGETLKKLQEQVQQIADAIKVCLIINYGMRWLKMV
jgi:hypothetical protein